MHKFIFNFKITLYLIIITLLFTFCFFHNNQLMAGGLSSVDFNYINDHFGDRATGLGGAYTAISDDPSGAYYNPAGIVFAFDNQISLSVNSYKYKHIEFEKAVPGASYEQEISSFYPSFFGVVQTLGSIKLAFTIINMNHVSLDQDDYFSGLTINDEGTERQAAFNINYNINDNTLLGGISGAHFIGNSISIGISIYGFRRHIEEIQNTIFIVQYDNYTQYLINNNYTTQNIYGLLGKLGIQVMPSDTLSIGFSIGQGYVLNHDYESQITNEVVTVGGALSDSIEFTPNAKQDIDDDEMPLNLRLGIAWFPSKDFLLSIDLIADIGDKYYQNDVENTFNAAIGMEYFLTRSFPIRMGFFTNLANTPEVNASNGNEDMHVDLYGFSMSLSWQTKSSSITLAGFYQLGTGEAIISDFTPVQDVTLYTYSISLTGSAKY